MPGVKHFAEISPLGLSDGKQLNQQLRSLSLQEMYGFNLSPNPSSTLNLSKSRPASILLQMHGYVFDELCLSKVDFSLSILLTFQDGGYALYRG